MRVSEEIVALSPDVSERSMYIGDANFGLKHVFPFVQGLQKGQRVLEVGSGPCLLLGDLAFSFPDIHFYGIEPAGPGFAAFKSFIAQTKSKTDFRLHEGGYETFETDGKSPLVGDPFPRLFMMSPHHIATLFGYKLGAVRFVSDEAFRRMNGWPAGTAVIWSDSHPLVKPAPWTSVFVPRADSPIWTLAVCEEVKWRAESHSTLESISGDEVKLHSLPSTDGAAWILKGDVLEREIGRLDIELRLDAPGSFDALRLVIDSEHQYHIEGATDEFEFSPGTVIRIRGFDIKRIFVPPASDA